MRIKQIKLYQFSELSEEAKDKAIESLYDVNVDYDWWESTYEDAANIGLKLTGFDIDRGSYCKGTFIESAESVANAILKDHGESCSTYHTAKAYFKELEAIIPDDDGDKDTEEIDDNFRRDLLEDYLVILRQEYEYQTSREAIIETIEANEYEFTEDGKLS